MINFGLIESDSVDRGRILVATRDFLVGDTLLVEPAIVVLQMPAGTFQTDAKGVGRMCEPFLQLDLAEQNAILDSCYCPMDGSVAKNFEFIASACQGEVGKRMMKFMVIMQLNAVEFDTPPATCLFMLASKTAHSCSPNSWWDVCIEDHKHVLVMKCLEPISAGEEVCVSYIGDETLFLPVEERRALLLQEKEFVCECVRCSSVDDDVRVFPCAIESSCSGVHYASATGGSSMGLCSVCNRKCTNAAVKGMLLQETELKNCLENTDHMLEEFKAIPYEFCSALLEQKSIHPLHYLTPRLALVQGTIHEEMRNFRAAVEAVTLRSGLWNRHLPFHPNAGLISEMLGDANLKAGDPVGAMSAYERACVVLLAVDKHNWDNQDGERTLRKLYDAMLRVPVALKRNDENDRLLDFNSLFQVGQLVVVCGLNTEALNGQVASVEEWRSDQGRYRIRIGESTYKCVKPENIMAVRRGDVQVSVGDAVVLHGLKSAAGLTLNGKVGTVEIVGDRCAVRTMDGERKLVRQECIAVFPAFTQKKLVSHRTA